MKLFAATTFKTNHVLFLFLTIVVCIVLLWIFKNIKKHYHVGPHKNIKYNKVFVINGKNYAERYNRTFDIVQGLLGFVNVKRWDAVFPTSNEMYGTTVKKDGVGTGVEENYTCSLKRGALGCAMSHRTLWKHIAENYKNDENWIIVFEDDISLPESVTPTDINKEMTRLFTQADKEDVDVVYLGYCWAFLCTHAYAIKPRGAKVLYENTYNCKKEKPKTIDVQMDVLRKNKVIKVLRASEHKKKDTSWAEGLIHQTKGDSIIQSHK